MGAGALFGEVTPVAGSHLFAVARAAQHGVMHAWSQIADHVTYLSVRPDPGRVLPGGYVNPLLLKNQPAATK